MYNILMIGDFLFTAYQQDSRIKFYWTENKKQPFYS